MARQGARLTKELRMLELEPPPGIAAYPKDDQLNVLEAQIMGAEGTPYEGGVFKLEVHIPDRYPMEPPKVRFITPIYHPNIDDGGRICLDTINMPPKGAWTPSLNISTVLSTVQLLMSSPNPDDGLMADITEEFKCNYPLFQKKARECTEKHAKELVGVGEATGKGKKTAEKEDETYDKDAASSGSDCDSDEDNERDPKRRKVV